MSESGFDVGKFVESFPVLAEAEGGITGLREMVLALAVRGSLIPQTPTSGVQKSSMGAGPWPVPPSWSFLTLAQLSGPDGIFCDGDWVESKDQDPGGDVRLTQLADVGDGVWRNRSDRRMNRATAERLRCTYLEVDDILIARMPEPIGRACLFPGDARTCATVVDVAVLRIRSKSINCRFVMMAINSKPVRDTISTMIAGTTRQRVSRSNLASILIPVPPVAEQAGIVAKVDELMRLLDDLEAKQAGKRQVQVRFRTSALDALTQAEGLDELAAAWKRVEGNWGVVATPEAIKKLREMILVLACRGVLVAQREMDGTADTLIATLAAKRRKGEDRSGLDSVPMSERPYPIPSSWRWIRFGDLGSFVGGGTPSKSNTEFWNGTIPWVSPKDMKRAYIDDAEDHISAAAVEGSAVKMIPARSLLFVVRGMILAHSFPSALCMRQVTINQDMKALVFAIPEMDEFVLRATWAARARVLEKVERSSHGTCRLDTADVARLPVAVPPVAEQKRIVAKVDQLMALCDALEAKLRHQEATASKLVGAVVAEMVA